MPLLCLKRDWHSVVVNIFFFDSRTQTLWSPHSAGDDSPYLKDLKFPMGIGQVGSVASNREPQIRDHKEVGDVDQADDALLPSSTDRAWTSATTTLAHKFWARHSLCVPMLTQVRARTPHPIALHLVAECGHWIGQTGRLVGVLQAINKVHFSGESHADDGFDQYILFHNSYLFFFQISGPRSRVPDLVSLCPPYKSSQNGPPRMASSSGLR